MRINFSMQLQFFFFFFLIFFAYAVTVSNFSELFFYAATVFFLPELILHKYSVEGYVGLDFLRFPCSIINQNRH